MEDRSQRQQPDYKDKTFRIKHKCKTGFNTIVDDFSCR